MATWSQVAIVNTHTDIMNRFFKLRPLRKNCWADSGVVKLQNAKPRAPQNLSAHSLCCIPSRKQKTSRCCEDAEKYAKFVETHLAGIRWNPWNFSSNPISCTLLTYTLFIIVSKKIKTFCKARDEFKWHTWWQVHYFLQNEQVPTIDLRQSSANQHEKTSKESPLSGEGGKTAKLCCFQDCGSFSSFSDLSTAHSTPQPRCSDF